MPRMRGLSGPDQALINEVQDSLDDLTEVVCPAPSEFVNMYSAYNNVEGPSESGDFQCIKAPCKGDFIPENFDLSQTEQLSMIAGRVREFVTGKESTVDAVAQKKMISNVLMGVALYILFLK